MKTPLLTRSEMFAEHSPETIEKIRRLAERPGTPGEGAAAKAALSRVGASATHDTHGANKISADKWQEQHDRTQAERDKGFTKEHATRASTNTSEHWHERSQAAHNACKDYRDYQKSRGK